MTRPTPPHPYESWLDYLLDGHIPESPYGRARAELAELRTERDKYKAMALGGVPMTPDPADAYLKQAKEQYNV